MKDFENVEVMWQPNENSGKEIRKFKAHISRKYDVKLDDYWSLHKWSVENFREFWAEVWDLGKIIHSKPYDEVFPIDDGIAPFDSTKWFPGARLNIAENLLKFRDDSTALICAGEERQTRKWTYAEVYKESCRYGAALKKLGLTTGDRVACYMSNREEALFAMIAATSCGAIWTGALPLLGAKAALARFRGTQPKFLFTIDRFINCGEENNMLDKVKEIADELKCLEKIIIVPSKPESVSKDISDIRNSCFLPNFLELGCCQDGSVPALEFEQLAFNHPVYISYTSGTSGAPKGLVHGISCLISLNRDFWIQSDSHRKTVWLSVSPAGWSTWNMFACILSLGHTLVIFEGVPFFLTPTFLWDFVDEYNISNLFLTPAVLDDLEKKGYVPNEKNHLRSLELIQSAGSIVKHQNYDFVYKKIKKDIIFGSVYGSTELMGASMHLEHTLPVHKGEISASALGVRIECFNDEGKSVVGEVGEFVITTPNPSVPLYLWNDKDSSQYKEAYLSKFKGAFCVGDLCAINPATNGVIIIGRSDDLLKPKGTRFGSVEIYNVVDTLPEIHDSICVAQYSSNGDERAVLFVKMRNGVQYSEDVVNTIRKVIQRELTIKHVPEIILETKDIPRNLSGKKMESIVKRIINKKPFNIENVINPECLENFINVPELQGY